MNPLLNIENMIPRIQHIPGGMRCFINNSLFYRDYVETRKAFIIFES